MALVAWAALAGRAAADDLIESLRFLRLIGITDDGQAEARIWDASTNTKVRIKQAAGFDRLPLIQTAKGKLLVCGVVQKIEARELIFRVNLYAVESKATKEVGAPLTALYKDEDVIYRVHKDHLSQLVSAEKVKAEEGDRLYVVHAAYWEQLLKDRVAVTTGGGRGFVFYLELVRGDVVDQGADLVVLRVAPKYCLDPGKPGAEPRWHEGFCVLRIGEKLEDALLEPLAEARVKELLKAR